MATLTATTVDEAGVEPTLDAAAGGGDQFLNNGVEFLYVKNGGGGSITVTITAQTTTGTTSLGQITKANASQAVSAGAEAFIGPFPKAAFNDSNGYAQVTYSGVTSVEVKVLKLG